MKQAGELRRSQLRGRQITMLQRMAHGLAAGLLHLQQLEKAMLGKGGGT